MLKKVFNRRNICCILILLLIVTSGSLPFFLYTGEKNSIFFISYFILIVIYFIKKKNYRFFKIDSLFRLVIVVYMAIIPILMGLPEFTNRYLQLSGILIFPIVFDTIDNETIHKSVSFILFILIIIINICTLNALSSYEFASRTADVSSKMQSLGVGSYSYIYALTIGVFVIINDICKKGSKCKKIAEIIVLFLSIITIIKSQFITAALALFASLFISILCYTIKKNSFTLNCLTIPLIFLLIVFILTTPIINKIAYFIIDLFPSTGRVSNIFEGSVTPFEAIINEFSNDRLPLMKNSINLISKYPIVGSIFSPNDLIMFGNHSTMLDTLAIWGIPLSFAYFYFMFKPIVKSIKYNILYLATLFAFLIIILFNNVEPTIIFVIYFYLYRKAEDM